MADEQEAVEQDVSVPEAAVPEAAVPDTSVPEAADFGGGMLSQDELDSLLAAVQDEEDAGLRDEGALLSEAGDTPSLEDTPLPSSVVSLPSFDTPSSAAVPVNGAGIGRVRDIPLEVTVELGRTRLLIKDILDLGTGSIIELDKLAGEPVDLYTNGLLMARGEVIVIDDNFGVRVTEIITAAERKREADAHAVAA